MFLESRRFEIVYTNKIAIYLWVIAFTSSKEAARGARGRGIAWRHAPGVLGSNSWHQFFQKNIPICRYLSRYIAVLKEMYISFAHLGNEECEQCALHNISHSECSEENCELFIQYNKHKLLYKETRKEYLNDKEAFSANEDWFCRFTEK